MRVEVRGEEIGRKERKEREKGGVLTKRWVPQRISDYSHSADAVRRDSC